MRKDSVGSHLYARLYAAKNRGRARGASTPVDVSSRPNSRETSISRRQASTSAPAGAVMIIPATPVLATSRIRENSRAPLCVMPFDTRDVGRRAWSRAGPGTARLVHGRAIDAAATLSSTVRVGAALVAIACLIAAPRANAPTARAAGASGPTRSTRRSTRRVAGRRSTGGTARGRRTRAVGPAGSPDRGAIRARTAPHPARGVVHAGDAVAGAVATAVARRAAPAATAVIAACRIARAPTSDGTCDGVSASVGPATAGFGVQARRRVGALLRVRRAPPFLEEEIGSRARRCAGRTDGPRRQQDEGR
jgi:hypothetical protein